MNPYEKYYLRKKIISAAVAVGAVALVGGALLIWQPWEYIPQNNDTTQPPVEQENNQPAGPEEPDLTITVGGKKVDCKLYQGNGWTIPYPMDWAVEEDGETVHFYPKGSSADGTCLTVTVADRAAYDGAFIAIGAKDFGDGAKGVERMFYHGSGRGYEVSCKLTEPDRETWEKTMTAMARTMTVGTERPFASLYPMASEPEWQLVDDEVVLFLDKDGVDIESVAERAVQERMNSWSNDVKANYTGKYRLGTPEWDSSYTCVSDDYVDVFCVTVQYQVAAGNNIVPGAGQTISGGWLTDETMLLYIAVYHDGSVVTKRVAGWGDRDYFGAEFASEVLR